MSEDRMRILVLDDEAPIVNLCLRILQADHHAVAGFTKIDEALARLAAETFDLLVVDYMMPGRNGFEVIRQARAYRPNIKVVLITGHGTPKVLGEAHEMKLSGILVKPFTPDELAGVVTAAFVPGESR